MTHDWVKIEHEYVCTNASMQELADKFHVSRNSISTHAQEGNWKEKRNDYRAKTAQKLGEKKLEKTVERVMSEEEKKTEIRALILTRTLEHLKRNDIDTQDLRRCQQIYTDLTLDDNTDEELHPLMRELVELEKNDKQ